MSSLASAATAEGAPVPESNWDADKAAILTAEVDKIQFLGSTLVANIHDANEAADGRMDSAAILDQLAKLRDVERMRIVAMRNASRLYRALAPHEAASQEDLPFLLPLPGPYERPSGTNQRAMNALREKACEAEIAEYGGEVPPEGGFFKLDENLAKLKAVELSLQHYHNWLVDIITVIERTERELPASGIAPLQVQHFLPRLPATSDEALEEANTVRWCQHIDTVLTVGVLMVIFILFGSQTALSAAMVKAAELIMERFEAMNS